MSDARAKPLPDVIEGYGSVKPYTGAFDNLGPVTKASVRVSSAVPGRSKVLPDIRSAIQACAIEDGAVISFHHHLRKATTSSIRSSMRSPVWD